MIRTVAARGLPVWIPGPPVTQGNMKTNAQGHAYYPNDAALQGWRSLVALYVQSAWRRRPSLKGPVNVRLEFILTPPKRPKNPYPIVRPDIDKLERAMLDALTISGVILDDAQIVTIHSTKRYGEPPGVLVQIGDGA